MSASDQRYTLTCVAAESLDKHVAVEIDTTADPPKVKTPGTAGNECRGVTMSSADGDGDHVRVCIEGPARLGVSEAVKEEDHAAADTDGLGTVATTGDFPIGPFLEDGASGDEVEILVRPLPIALS